MTCAMSIDFGGGIVLIGLPPVVLTAALATLDAARQFKFLKEYLLLLQQLFHLLQQGTGLQRLLHEIVHRQILFVRCKA